MRFTFFTSNGIDMSLLIRKKKSKKGGKDKRGTTANERRERNRALVIFLYLECRKEERGLRGYFEMIGKERKGRKAQLEIEGSCKKIRINMLI